MQNWAEGKHQDTGEAIRYTHMLQIYSNHQLFETFNMKDCPPWCHLIQRKHDGHVQVSYMQDGCILTHLQSFSIPLQDASKMPWLMMQFSEGIRQSCYWVAKTIIQLKRICVSPCLNHVQIMQQHSPYISCTWRPKSCKMNCTLQQINQDCMNNSRYWSWALETANPSL